MDRPVEQKLDLNDASVEELSMIEGIDRRVAERIAKYRDQIGRIYTWVELEDIPGISEDVIEILKDNTSLENMWDEGDSSW
jgi:competence protein ComEA